VRSHGATGVGPVKPYFAMLLPVAREALRRQCLHGEWRCASTSTPVE
jgi:hypothetical protein